MKRNRNLINQYDRNEIKDYINRTKIKIFKFSEK